MVGNLPSLCFQHNTQGQRPVWMVLFGGAGEQRYRLDDWAMSIIESLTSTGCWVAIRRGAQIELHHTSRVSLP